MAAKKADLSVYRDAVVKLDATDDDAHWHNYSGSFVLVEVSANLYQRKCQHFWETVDVDKHCHYWTYGIFFGATFSPALAAI